MAYYNQSGRRMRNINQIRKTLALSTQIDEAAMSKVFKWWFGKSPEEIDDEVKKMSISELEKITRGVSPKSARRILSGIKLKKFEAAHARMEKMRK
jgi:hypothetical protein